MSKQPVSPEPPTVQAGASWIEAAAREWMPQWEQDDLRPMLVEVITRHAAPLAQQVEALRAALERIAVEDHAREVYQYMAAAALKAAQEPK